MMLESDVTVSGARRVSDGTADEGYHLTDRKHDSACACQSGFPSYSDCQCEDTADGGYQADNEHDSACAYGMGFPRYSDCQCDGTGK